MASQRELDLILKVAIQGADALNQLQAQIQTIATTPFTFGGAIDSIRQLAQEFAKLNGTAEENAAAKAGSQVASEAAKASQQLAKARAEEEKVNQQAAKTEAERLKTQKEALLLDQQTLKNETEKARAIQATANAEAAQSRAKAAAIRTERVENPPEKKEGGGLAGGVAAGIKAVFPELAIASAAFNQVSEAVGNIGEAIGKVGEFGSKVFEGLIAQVVETRTQILGISSQIAATQQIFADGQKISDPLKAIQAVTPEVEKAYKQLQQDSTETISTTAELEPIFQTVTGQLSNLNINIAQAEKLSVRLSQAASGIGLPYQQASQEIASLVRGEITQYNQLAKSLGISQSFYNTLVAQGRLYEVLQERTKALAEGQKLAADQLPGVLSTIRDVFEIIVQQAGGPVLDAVLKPIIAFRDFLKANQETIEAAAKAGSEAIVGLFDAIVKPFIEQLQPAFAALGNYYQTLGKLFNDFVQGPGQTLSAYFGKVASFIGAVLNGAIVGLANGFTLLVKVFDAIISNPIVQFLQAVVLGALGAIVDAATLVVNAFSGLSSAFSGTFGEVLDTITAGEKTITGAFGALFGVFQKASFIVESVLGGIAGKVLSVFTPIVTALQALGNGIVTTVVAPVKFVQDTYGRLFGFVGQVTGKIVSIIESVIDNPAFKAVAKIVGVNIDEVKEGLKKLDEESKNNGFKKVGDDAETAGKKITTANQALDDLGKTPDLVKSQLAGAFRLLGDRTKAEEGAKQVVDLTQKAIENGVISRAEGERNLKAIQNNTGLELDTRLNAQKALTKIIQDGAEERLEAIKTREKQEEDAIKSGQVSQIAGDRELTKLKQEELDKQIDAKQKQLDREGAENRGLGPDATKYRNELQRLQADREALIEEGKRKEAAAVETGLEEQNKILSDKRAEGLITEAEFGKQSLDLINKRGEAQKAELERQRGLLKPDDKEGQSAIDAKEAALSESLIKQREQVVKEANRDEIEAAKAKETLISDSVKAGRISQIEGDKQLTAAKLEELDKQAESIKQQLAVASPNSPDGKRLLREQAELEAQRTGVVEDGNRKRAQAELTAADNELKILEGKRVSGKLSEEAFANEALAITRKRIDAELKELERERSLLKPGDKAGQEDIDAKEAELNSKREKAEEDFQARKLAIVERAQKRAEDSAKLSEISRNTEIDKLLAARQIRETEAGLLRVQSSKATIAKELELEKQKIAELQKLPSLSDPVKEEERQQKIRASRIRSAELADQLVKNEIEQQQALFRVVSERLDRQAQASKNAAEGQIQPLQAQLQLQDALSKLLDNQNKLLESRKSLQSALSGYVEGELGILAKSAKTDDERQRVAQLTAAAKFKALQQQQAIEQQSLEIQIKQNQAALIREQIQNRIAKLQNAADVAQATADLAKAKAKPDATPEEIEAARLNLEAKKLAGQGLEQQGDLLKQQGQINEVTAQNQRQVLALKQQGELDQGKQGLIDALPEGAKQQAQQNLTQEILQRLGLGNAIGDINTDLITNATLQQRGVGNFGLPGGLNPSAPATNPELNKLLNEAVSTGKGSGDQKNQASDLEQTLKQQQANETQQRERQGDRALSQQQTEAEKQRQGVINALEQKRTQLVLLQGEQGEALLSIEESLANGGGDGAASGTVKGRVAGQNQKELIQGVLSQFKDGAIPKSKDLDGVLEAFRRSTERKIVATLPANPFKEAEQALKDSIAEDVKQGRGGDEATADKREALDKLEKARTQLVLLQGAQGTAILSLSETAKKTDTVIKNTGETAARIEQVNESVKAGPITASRQPIDSAIDGKQASTRTFLGVSEDRIQKELEQNKATYAAIAKERGGDNFKRAAEKLAVEDSIAQRIALEKAGKLQRRDGAALTVGIDQTLSVDRVPSLVQPQRAIAPISGSVGNAQMMAVLEKINKGIETAQLRPVSATVNNSIAGPDASTVVDLATKRMTDNLVGVLGRIK